jgi:hypothetical protein
MDFKTVVNNISTSNELKRVANAYVIDFRSLSRQELVEALIKTAPQYSHRENVQKTLDECLYHDNRNLRTITPIIIKHVILNKDDYKLESKKLNEEIIKFEQQIVNKSNEFSIAKNHPRKHELELFSFVLETAWDSEDSISVDEKNLIVKIQHKLGISENEYMILESQLGKFPKKKNIIHSNEEIDGVKRELQKMGLLFKVRNDDGVDFDIIPTEIVKTLREIYGIEIKKQGYIKLLENKRLRSKDYLIDIITRSGINISKYLKVDELKEILINNVKPSILLGGFNYRDGLSSDAIYDWVKELGVGVSGSKETRIFKIIEYFDSYKEKVFVEVDDERIEWFNNYELLASRNLEELRKRQVISKDLECEKKFEKATDYIFQVLLNNDPLDLMGSEHPDGILTFNDKLIMWDNKSKETPVNLKDHMSQFDRYIRSSEKNVASFLVIGPSFTDQSIEEAMKYQLLNDTVITLITAEELKMLAIKWNSKKGDETFPLGYFKQPGKFNSNLISY